MVSGTISGKRKNYFSGSFEKGSVPNFYESILPASVKKASFQREKSPEDQ